MKILSERQIVMLHDQLIRETGGTQGLRDEALLQSAMAAPFQSFSGTDVFPSLQQKAARLAYGLVSNHHMPRFRINAKARPFCYSSL